MKHPVERVLAWACGTDRLVGIVSVPDAAASDLAVVIIVGGPQYRVGSHRQFTLLARQLACAGYLTLRFDYRGMGDSSGDARDFESVTEDIASAIDALQAHLAGVRRIVLWGLCDGASAALLYVRSTGDKRVAGLCLLNPWVRSAQGLAKARVKHYYLHRLRQPEFWRKLFNGKVAARSVVDLARNVGSAGMRPEQRREMPSFRERMLEGLGGFRGAVLVVLSENDLTAQEFVQYTRDHATWSKVMASPHVQRQDVRDADHTFSTPAAHRALVQGTADWLARLTAATAGRLPDVRANATMDAPLP
jgi:exosortase A-associated hydrolase 1